MIEFQHVSKTFEGLTAVDDLSLQIAQGEFTVLIGPSGSGKTTTLKMINRLLAHDGGRILLKGQDIRRLRVEDLRRGMGYVIQSIGLFPHWTVEKNIATVPRLLNWPEARIQARVTELLTLLKLAPELYRQRYPHQLSGGQQQRVGVARALAADPDILLMDEPFGALDPVARSAMQTEMARIHQLTGKTIVLVTHDMDEALRLASRIVLLHQGRLVQQGTPQQLLANPANDFVRDFVGRSDLGIKLLGLSSVAACVRHGEVAEGEPISTGMSLREALSVFILRRSQRLPVVDAHGQPLGVLDFADLLRCRP